MHATVALSTVLFQFAMLAASAHSTPPLQPAMGAAANAARTKTPHFVMRAAGALQTIPFHAMWATRHQALLRSTCATWLRHRATWSKATLFLKPQPVLFAANKHILDHHVLKLRKQ